VLLRSLVLLVAAFLLLGCGVRWRPPAQNGSFVPPAQEYVCVDLPREQQAAAAEAVEGWDNALKQWKRLTAIEGRQEPCTYWVHEADRPEDDESRALAWVSMLGGREIFMRRGWYEHDTTAILMHELGHAFGAQHVPGTLMNITYQRRAFACPDATTVAQVAAWNHVSIELLAWCL